MFSTMSKSSGKRYFEIKNTSLGGSSNSRGAMVGIGTTAAAKTGDGASNNAFWSFEFGADQANLSKDRGGNVTIAATAYSKSTPFYGGILCDLDAGTIGIITPLGERIDNLYTGVPTDVYYPIIGAHGALVNNNATASINYGETAFQFGLPAGYTPWYA